MSKMHTWQTSLSFAQRCHTCHTWEHVTTHATHGSMSPSESNSPTFTTLDPITVEHKQSRLSTNTHVWESTITLESTLESKQGRLSTSTHFWGSQGLWAFHPSGISSFGSLGYSYDEVWWGMSWWGMSCNHLTCLPPTTTHPLTTFPTRAISRDQEKAAHQKAAATMSIEQQTFREFSPGTFEFFWSGLWGAGRVSEAGNATVRTCVCSLSATLQPRWLSNLHVGRHMSPVSHALV